ncbi:MAG: hypothetical protein IJO85_09805 [Lachnospiraceae bacterium]|nr:hypothetical protein [Lachnospiraceae bacterium]
MRERVKQVLEWIHATLLFPLWIPVLYELGDIQGAEYGYILYLKSFLIVIPVIVTSIAVKKCKSLFAYLGASLVAAVATLALAWILQPTEYGMVYVVGLGAECGFLIIKRFRDRLRMAVERQDSADDPFWEPSFSVLNRPTFGTLGYFVVIYVIGMAFMSKTTCDEAFFTAMFYVFVVILHVFLVETKDYLRMNRQVSGLPSKRIYGIAGGTLGFFMILIFLVSIPSILTIPMRQYTDIRTWSTGEIEIVGGMDAEIEHESTPSIQEQLDMLGGEYQEPRELPMWIKAMLAVGVVAIMLLILGAIIKEILNVFSDFRETYDDDNGDKIEVLEEEESATFIKHSSGEAEDMETRSVRKRYRKMIRKHRKDKPAVYESPTEIEELAGLLDDKEMQKLHIEYEAYRYGK